MFSVTQRIKTVKQPRGGYIQPKSFTATQLQDTSALNPIENIHANLVGLAVDYLTRFIMGTPAAKAFEISLMGSFTVRETATAQKLLSKIKGLDNESIKCACKLVGYDVCFRSGPAAFKPVSEIRPDAATIENIRIMVNRSLSFWESYGPIVLDGFTFEGGYTKIVSTGDGDFMTADTLWDFKVSLEKPKSKHTLQLLMYYIMGCHSIHPEFQSIQKLGIFNPRLNIVYTLNIADIPQSVIETVSREVIGYN